eukprot:UN25131
MNDTYDSKITKNLLIITPGSNSTLSRENRSFALYISRKPRYNSICTQEQNREEPNVKCRVCIFEKLYFDLCYHLYSNKNNILKLLKLVQYQQRNFQM